MTVKKTHSKITKSNSTLQLTGSQINLSPRPVPVTNSHWSSQCRTYPMRRSVSAFGFQQTDEEHSNVSSRPLSADNIRYSKNKRFSSDFSSDTTNISSSQVFGETCYSSNIHENITNSYSEKFFSNSLPNRTTKSNLIPGLSSKPPLPPAESKYHSTIEDCSNVNEPKNNATNIPTAISEQEAFDEIIALKFQRWFPNTSSVIHEESSSGKDQVEMLSYKQRQQYQTCEYRYEIFKKNKILTSDDENKKAPKSNRPKIKTSKSGKGRVKYEEMPEAGELEDDEQSVTEIPTSKVDIFDKVDDLDALQALEERDMQILRERQNSKLDKMESKDKSKQHVEETFELKNSSPKASPPKKTSCLSPINRPLKKQKKISFSTSRRGSAEIRPKKSAQSSEPYAAGKYSNEEFGKEINGSVEMENETEYSTDAFRHSANSLPAGSLPAGSQIEDVLSRMDAHRLATPRSKMTTLEAEPNHSMYEEIVDILKDIEKEEIRDDLKNSKPISKEITPSSPARAIWSLLEEAEKNNIINESNIHHLSSENTRPDNAAPSGSQTTNAEESKNWSRLSDLLRYSSAELAQKVMTLQLLLDEKESALQNLNSRLKSNEQIRQQQKQELECSIKKCQRHMEQIQHEKKVAVEKFENMIKDMERKHSNEVQTVEDKYRAELKRSLEKQIAADKLEREKWKEIETKKIQERAIKGFQPELNRMTKAHEEELAEVHKCYKKQLEETEETCNRRMAVQKEKFEAEKEKALAIEREIWRQKLEDEISELEKRFQDQRKRLLAEVHVERENIERANEATLAVREKENERKWQGKSLEMQKRIEALQLQHQEEIQKLHHNLETEKQMWIKNQTMEFMEKENKIKEHCKKERDKHIELIIQKLENENSEREQAAEQKMRRLKEQYETEIHDVEITNETLRRKLNESRSELQKLEEIHSQLRSQLNQSQTEYIILKEKFDRLVQEQQEIQNVAKSEFSTKNHILQSELNQAQLTYESQIKLQHNEHERELSQMYNKFKEIVLRKDETIDSLKKQKEAALLQCNQLEKFLDLKRKEHKVLG